MMNDMKIGLAIFFLVVFGFLVGRLSETRGQAPMPTPAEIRAELISRCVAVPDVIAEIEDKLPDNIDALITPAIMRKVLRDVVSHC